MERYASRTDAFRMLAFAGIASFALAALLQAFVKDTSPIAYLPFVLAGLRLRNPLPGIVTGVCVGGAVGLAVGLAADLDVMGEVLAGSAAGLAAGVVVAVLAGMPWGSAD